MKKLLCTAALFLVAANSFALAGIGFHAGFDLLDIAKIDREFDLTVGGQGYKYTVTRDAITNPLSAGAQVYFDLPIFDIGLEAGFSAAWAEYNWSAPDKLTPVGHTQEFNITIPGVEQKDGKYSEKSYYTRMCADVTAKYYFLSFPPAINITRFYVGGGAGLYFITPLASEEVFVKELGKVKAGTTKADVDMVELIKDNTVFGGHAVAGVQIKPPIIPLAINLDYKYNFTPENDYKDKNNNFGTLKAGLSFYI